MNVINIKTPYIKLDQLLKFANICETGGIAKEAIQSGRVFVNKQKEIRRGKKIFDGDIISFDCQEFVVRQDGGSDGDKKIKSEEFPKLL